MPSAEVIEWLSKGGVVVLLLFVWFRAEKRADAEREKNEALAREVITQSAKTEATLDKLASVLTGRKNGS